MKNKVKTNNIFIDKGALIPLFLLYSVVAMHVIYPDPPGASASQLGLFIGISIALLCLALAGFGYVIKGRLPQKKQAIELVFSLVFLPPMGFVATNLISSVYFIANKATYFSISSNTKIIWALTVLAVGAIFFVFRYKYRFIYGAIEAIVGAAVGCQYLDTLISNQLGRSSLESSIVATLTGGIYLVVRGFDNMHNGMKSDPLGKSVQKLMESFTGHDEDQNPTKE